MAAESFLKNFKKSPLIVLFCFAFLALSCEEDIIQINQKSILVNTQQTGLATNSTVSMAATGGTAPYTYSIMSGPGSIDPITGLYSASSTKGSVIIQIQDSSGDKITKILQVVDPLSVSPAPTDWDAFTDLPLTVSGGSGAEYEFSFASFFESLWDSVTTTLTRGWSTKPFSLTVTDPLGFSQTFEFTMKPGSLVFPSTSPGWNYLNAPMYDAAGNIYFVGGAQGQFNDLNITGATQDIVMKINPKGQIVWTKSFGGTTDAGQWDQVVKGDYVYVAGTGYGAGLYEGQSITGSRGGYVYKLRTSDGGVEWLKIYDAVGTTSMLTGIDVDNDGNVYVSGTGSAALYGAPAPGGQDAFLSKISASGTVEWLSYQGGTTGYHPSAAVQPDGTALLLGASDGNTLPGAINPTHLRQPTISKFSSLGVKLWTVQMPTTKVNTDGWTDRSIQSASLNNKVLMCSHQKNYSDYLPRALTIGLYSSTGSEILFQEFGDGTSTFSQPRCVAGPDGFYMAFRSSLPFETLGNSTQDLVVLKYDYSGARVWSKKIPVQITSGLPSGDSIGSSFAFNDSIYFHITGEADLDGDTVFEHETAQIKVATNGDAQVRYANYQIPVGSGTWLSSTISVNPVTGDFYDGGGICDMIFAGVYTDDWCGSQVSKFNSDFERQ